MVPCAIIVLKEWSSNQQRAAYMCNLINLVVEEAAIQCTYNVQRRVHIEQYSQDTPRALRARFIFQALVWRILVSDSGRMRDACLWFGKKQPAKATTV